MPRVLAALVCLTACTHADDLPDALEQAIRARQWRTGRASWVVTKSAVGVAPRFYDATFTERERIIAWLGDEEGVVARDESGAPKENGFGPMYTLVAAGEWWQHQEGALSATLTDRAGMEGTPDFRALGLSTDPLCSSLESAARPMGGERPRYRQRRDGEYVIITMDAGAAYTSWTIDPAKSHSVVNVESGVDGVALQQARVTLGRFGESWFPQSVEFYDLKASASEPREIIEVLDLQPDAKDVPERLSPADIRIDTGINVVLRDERMRPKPGMFKWDGARPVPLDEYNERFRAGEIKSGAVFDANWQRAQALEALRKAREAAGSSRPIGSVLSVTVDEWEAYTRRFIERYRLDGEQCQKAMTHLLSAREDLEVFRIRNRATLDALETELDELSRASDVGKVDRTKAWNERRAALLRPLDDVFRTRLAEPLERLPTRAQRRMVDRRWHASQSRPASAPSTAPQPAGGR